MNYYLAVDDEPIVLGVLTRAIEDAEPGCEVRAFESPEATLEALTKTDFRPQAAFLDIEMYGMLGLDLARRIKDISPDTKIIFVTGYAQYAIEAFSIHARGYVLKPVTVEKIRQELDDLYGAPPAPESTHRLFIQCFGNFEVYLDGKRFVFNRNKTKELLAYLVDRRGAVVTTSELCAVLWEDNPNGESQRNQLRVLISDLSRSLNAVGEAQVLKKSRNSFSVSPDQFDCDFYRFLMHEPNAVNAYRGEYMAQYSWAEFTVGSFA